MSATWAALLLLPGSSASKSPSIPGDPVALFDVVFRPVEKAMGIDLKVSGLKVNLLTGQMTIGKVTGTHPKQGNFAVVKGLRFPFAAIAGLADPSKSYTVVQKLNLKLDFGCKPFWKVKSPTGAPIPGTPNLKLGKLAIENGSVKLKHGNGPTLKISGFSGEVSKLRLPAKLWSKGKVPSSRWVEAELRGGSIQMSGISHELLLSRASFHFNSSTFHITSFEGTLQGGGKLTLGGEVKMRGGKPKAYDLIVKLDEVPLDRPGVTAVATGSLVVKGPAGHVKVGGKLDLDDVGDLRAAKWSSEGCSDKVSLAVTLAPSEESGFQSAKMLGSMCRGRIDTD